MSRHIVYERYCVLHLLGSKYFAPLSTCKGRLIKFTLMMMMMMMMILGSLESSQCTSY